MNTKSIIKKLNAIANEPADSLRKEVAKECFNHENIECFFSDLSHYGCASWMIGKLIYYKDTYAFYDKYYNEIEELREEYEQNTGMPIKIEGDLKNFFAWFGFEETAYQLADELGLNG